MDEEIDDPPGLARVELEPGEERSMRWLASALGIVGMIQIVAAGLALLWMLVALIPSLGAIIGGGATRLVVTALGLAYVALPVWQGVMLREAGETIGRVAGPDEDDQEFLASAFRRLKVVFTIELLLALWGLYDKLD
ncbi:MAG: hypothetical protein H0T76_15210 [Nannocystis sp.]|nr:hypothetical protein [Nannocystis sp.]